MRAVDALDELALLGSWRCHGWTRLDVVVHVLGGWQEMLGGLVSLVDDSPTVDAASYWTAFADKFGDDDPVEDLMAQRRRTATYSRPGSAVAQLHDAAAALQRGIASCTDRPLLWQGQVFTAGDFLTTWTVEDVVHQLDLDLDLDLDDGVDGDMAPPSSALGLARRTVEELLGEALPATWTDLDVVLVGNGRVPPPADVAGLAARLPALG